MCADSFILIMANLFIKYFEDSFKRNWSLPAMTNYMTQKGLSFEEFSAEIAKLHLLFKELGVSQQDKIAIVGPNSTSCAFVFMATILYGAVAVPILEDFQPEDIVGIINHSDARLVFATEDNVERIEGRDMPKVQSFLSLSFTDQLRVLKGDPLAGSLDRLQTLFDEAYPKGFSQEDVHFTDKDGDDMMVLSYTSGTTGFVKGVMLSAENFRTVLDFSQKFNIGNPGDKVVSVLPLAHTYGCVYDLFRPLIAGVNVYYFGRIPSPKLLMKALAEMKPEWFSTVPLFLEVIYKKKVAPILKQRKMQFLMKLPIFSNIVLKRLRTELMGAFGGELKLMFVGGAALSKEVEDFFHKINFPFTVGYGMTECAPLISIDFTNPVPHSVGKVIDGVEVKIDSDEPNKVPGEILVRGGNVMKGYYKDEMSTHNAFSDDGWFRTGDVGVFDNEGNLFLRGRTKSLILTASGQNVYPEEIEARLNNKSIVAESLVVLRNNKLVALVYPDASALDDANDSAKLAELMEGVRKETNMSLSSYEYLNAIEIRKEPFEKTPKRSIKRYLYK